MDTEHVETCLKNIEKCQTLGQKILAHTLCSFHYQDLKVALKCFQCQMFLSQPLVLHTHKKGPMIDDKDCNNSSKFTLSVQYYNMSQYVYDISNYGTK